MTDRDNTAGGRRKRRAGGFERDLLRRIATELRHRDPQGRAGGPTALSGGSRSSDRRVARGGDVLASTLELARAETSMDVAVLGEIHAGREVVHLVVGDGGSFGLAVGASLPVEETYCQHLLQGRLGNVVRDASNEELVRDLEPTHAARMEPTSAFP